MGHLLSSRLVVHLWGPRIFIFIFPRSFLAHLQHFFFSTILLLSKFSSGRAHDSLRERKLLSPAKNGWTCVWDLAYHVSAIPVYYNPRYSSFLKSNTHRWVTYTVLNAALKNSSALDVLVVRTFENRNRTNIRIFESKKCSIILSSNSLA